MNIYITGVGGQGIGMLSEILLRAADHAGLKVKGVDTHGLAQRGGIVISQLRFGDNNYSPLIGENQADIVVALERHEALRGINRFLKNGGTLIYYNAVWQPLEVRLNDAEEVSEELLLKQCRKRNINIIGVFNEGLESPRMQNIAILANICKHKIIPSLKKEHYLKAIDDLMEGDMLDKNMHVFEQVI